MIASDTSPLIFFGKTGNLYLLKKCFQKVIIPQKVFGEICEKPSEEETSIRQAIHSGWIILEKVAVLPILEDAAIGEGEKEALSLAYKRKISLLVDDDSAKAYAAVLHVKAYGSLHVLLLACRKGHITKEDSKRIFLDFMSKGFYVSPGLYARFMQMVDSI